MTKASTEPRKIKQSNEHLSMHMQDVLNRLENVAEYSGMSLVAIQHAVQLLLEKCGESAQLWISCDDYWGSGATLEWHRTETAKEVTKRLAKNAKRRATIKKNKPIVDKKKVAADMKELARLQKLYPEGTS